MSTCAGYSGVYDPLKVKVPIKPSILEVPIEAMEYALGNTTPSVMKCVSGANDIEPRLHSSDLYHIT